MVSSNYKIISNAQHLDLKRLLRNILFLNLEGTIKKSAKVPEPIDS
jgi:hypothetical protein